MANPNKARGDRHERETRNFLAEVFGRLVKRPRQEGLQDVGDIHVSPFVLQAKNWRDTVAAIRAGVEGAEEQARNAEEPYGVAVVKMRGKGAAYSRVVMTLATFRRVLARLLRAERLLQRHAPDAYAQHMAEVEQDR